MPDNVDDRYYAAAIEAGNSSCRALPWKAYWHIGSKDVEN
jgi:hypothetical protein